MALVLSEDQRFLKDTAHSFFQEKMPVTHFRALRDTGDPIGFSKEMWGEMAALGWAGIIFPEGYGGSDFGHVGLGTVMEEAGRTLAPSPLFSTVLMAGSAILLGGSEAQRRDILPAIAAGTRFLALALEEKAHHAPAEIAVQAHKVDEGYRIDGTKSFVIDGMAADQLVVVARTAGQPGDTQGLTLFLVDADAPGLERQALHMADSRGMARITFNGVTIGSEAIVGSVGDGWALLEQVLDRARIGLAAEMLGATLEAFERTVAYLKERSQFGQPIGSFQALKHRAAEMFAEIELTKSVVLDALSAIDERRNDIAQAASLAKVRANDTLHRVSNEFLQMHGGIGMTDEYDMGLFMKRARVAQATLGDSRFHRDRYALLERF